MNNPPVPNSRSKAVAAPQASWGKRDINPENFIISKVLPMQPGSPMVTDGKAVFGEMRDSVTAELIAPLGKSVAFVPIELKETWQISHLEGKEWVIKSTIPYTNGNSKLAKEETVNGVQIKRNHIMDFYVLLMPDLLKGIDFPKIISFRSTSLRAGRVLYTSMYHLNDRQGLSPAGMIMAVSCKKTEKVIDGKKVSWVLLEVTPVEKAHADYVEAAKKWYNIISEGKTEVDATEEL